MGLGTLVAPEDPADPMDQELPAEHAHCQKTEQNVQTHKRNQKIAKTKKTPEKVSLNLLNETLENLRNPKNLGLKELNRKNLMEPGPHV